MDVVHSAVKQLGGSITIMSMPGKGTRFTVRLPFTVSVNRALMVSVRGGSIRDPAEHDRRHRARVRRTNSKGCIGPMAAVSNTPVCRYRVRYLGSFIGRDYVALSDRGSVPVVLVRSGERAVAVHVDGVQGSREIVVKSLGPQFAGVGGISGATILGDGSVVVILDLLALIRAQTAPICRQRSRLQPRSIGPTCVMVVDDSVTVRKVTSRLLERQGMDVMIAKDGVEAVAMLQERRPDIMLLDIEMPRMDGFEVARQIRHDERLSNLPIVMISSRTGSKHQERAARTWRQSLPRQAVPGERAACDDRRARTLEHQSRKWRQLLADGRKGTSMCDDSARGHALAAAEHDDRRNSAVASHQTDGGRPEVVSGTAGLAR